MCANQPFWYWAMIITQCSMFGRYSTVSTINPPKIVECVGPPTERVFTLIGGAKTPPPRRQEEQKESILAALLYVLPVRDYGVLGWILAKWYPRNVSIFRGSIEAPIRLKVHVPLLPLCSETINKVGNIWHVAKVTMMFEPVMDGIRPTLTAESFFLTLGQN